jgi:uncharacterized protein YndB with AHSA1/START domain
MKKVEVTISVETSPQNVISAFTDPRKLGKWWQVEKTLIEPKTGGVYTLASAVSEKGMRYVSAGIIKTYLPDHELMVENFVYLNPDKPFLGPMSLTVRATEKDAK